MLELMSDQVRKHAPLIHNMTNRVSINDCANILLACGASPIMAEAIEEVEEITAMCGVCGTRGVDAEPADLMGEKNLYQNVKMVTAFAEKSGAVVAATGKNDIVSDGRKAYWIQNGHSMMQTVTGVGCQLSALTAAYVAANPKHTLEAVTAAVSAIGVCGELAYERMSDLDGNASYRNYLTDAVYRLDGKKLERLARVDRR